MASSAATWGAAPRSPSSCCRSSSCSRCGCYAHRAERRWRKVRRTLLQRALRTIGHRTLVLLFTVFAVFPSIWLLVTTFKQNAALSVGAPNAKPNPFIFNLPPPLDHLTYLFAKTLYSKWLVNTLSVGLGSS